MSEFKELVATLTEIKTTFDIVNEKVNTLLNSSNLDKSEKKEIEKQEKKIFSKLKKYLTNLEVSNDEFETDDDLVDSANKLNKTANEIGAKIDFWLNSSNNIKSVKKVAKKDDVKVFKTIRQYFDFKFKEDETFFNNYYGDNLLKKLKKNAKEKCSKIDNEKKRNTARIKVFYEGLRDMPGKDENGKVIKKKGEKLLRSMKDSYNKDQKNKSFETVKSEKKTIKKQTKKRKSNSSDDESDSDSDVKPKKKPKKKTPKKAPKKTSKKRKTDTSDEESDSDVKPKKKPKKPTKRKPASSDDESDSDEKPTKRPVRRTPKKGRRKIIDSDSD